jgi:hypothetical protein
MPSPIINACTHKRSPPCQMVFRELFWPYLLHEDEFLLLYIQVLRTPIVLCGLIRIHHKDFKFGEREKHGIDPFLPINLSKKNSSNHVGVHHQVNTTYRALLSGVRPLKDILIYFLKSPNNVH